MRESQPEALNKPPDKLSQTQKKEHIVLQDKPKRKAIRPNWDIIKNEYIRYPMTYDELSVKYGVSVKTLERHAAGKCQCCKGWGYLRAEYKEKVRIKTLNVAVDNAVSDRQKLIQSIEELVNLKITAERRVLVKTAELSDEDLRLMASILNKSKNNIPDLTKIAELLKGNATDRSELTAPEKQARIGRLKGMLEPSQS